MNRFANHPTYVIAGAVLGQVKAQVGDCRSGGSAKQVHPTADSHEIVFDHSMLRVSPRSHGHLSGDSGDPATGSLRHFQDRPATGPSYP